MPLTEANKEIEGRKATLTLSATSRFARTTASMLIWYSSELWYPTRMRRFSLLVGSVVILVTGLLLVRVGYINTSFQGQGESDQCASLWRLNSGGCTVLWSTIRLLGVISLGIGGALIGTSILLIGSRPKSEV